MLLNTSLNVMGEPIVERPEEALELVRRRGIDCLVMGARLFDSEGEAVGPSRDLLP